ncbi:MAG: bifunctional adenosylcobinamide kinase/adenosylcobinamide-phosphate guanylyltransferase [Spirochaetales bacterium]|nr:bifunctional adenosylcobinamide kinase/adenosylcobinamide-phosphate guanylyltransferase [Spirochaetales bacterium]
MKIKKPEIIFITGGARSGKSDAAVKLASLYGEKVIYIATGYAGDEEMKQRIEAHKKQRPSSWITVEAETGVGKELSYLGENTDAVILDCLTMLTSNILLKKDMKKNGEAGEKRIKEELDILLDECSRKRASCIIVSNEVGMGIVPATGIGRLYRDVLGKVNKYIAAKADRVLLMISGLAVDVKNLSVAIGHIHQK